MSPPKTRTGRPAQAPGPQDSATTPTNEGQVNSGGGQNHEAPTVDDFLVTLYGLGDGWVHLTKLKGQLASVRCIDVATLAELIAGRLDVYLSGAVIGTKRGSGDNGRIEDTDACQLTHLWADLDREGLGHKTKDPLWTRDDITRLWYSLPLTPTASVDSGGGWWFHWALTEPVPLNQDGTGELLLARWAEWWKQIGNTYNRHIDGVFNPGRIIRAPGSINGKEDLRRPAVLKALYPENRYTLDQFDELLPARESPTTTYPWSGNGDRPGDEYNREATVERMVALLEDHGFHSPRPRGGRVDLTRPGKEARDGHSATVWPDATVTFWSSAAEGLPGKVTLRDRYGASGTYDPFGVFASLEHGGDFEAAARELNPPRLVSLPSGGASAANPETTWRPVDLAAFLTGHHLADRPSILRRSDGVALLYRGRVHSLYGEPEGLKTWVALEACRQELEAGNTVAYIDFEDSVAGIVARLRNLGISDDVITTRFIYIRPAERITPKAWEGITPTLSTATLTVIDGTTEAMVMEGLNLLDNSDVATFFERLPRSVARLGPAVLNLDHVGRNKETRGRFAIGAQAKLAGIDGAAYSITVTKPFGRGKTGQADIRLTKDRLGYVSEHVEDEHRTIASVEAASDTETVAIGLNIPGEFVPTILMEKVAEAIAATPGISQKQIRDSVSGKDEWKRKALHQLVARGYVTTEPGPRGAILHTLEHPYRDGDQLRSYDLFPPVPHLFPEQVKVPFSPVPTHSVGTAEGLSENKTYSEDFGNRSSGGSDDPCAVCDKADPDATYYGEPVHADCAPGGKVDPL